MHSQTAYGVAMAQATLVANGIGVSMTFETGSGITIARRTLVANFMKSNCDFAWWVDSDMSFPADAPLKLLRRGVPLVGCNYRKRYFPNPHFTAMNGEPGKTVEYKTEAASPEMERVDCIPHGMMLVHRSVYERVPGPHYIFEYNENHTMEVGEDYYFCAKARKHGIDVWCDNDLSRQIAHIGICNFDPGMTQVVTAIKDGVIPGIIPSSSK